MSGNRAPRRSIPAPADQVPGPRGGPGTSSGVGAAHPAAALRGPLVLVQATPGAVLLRPGNGVVQALVTHRAAGTQGLGLPLADVPLRLPFTIWAEEKHDIRAAARGGILPAPVRPGRQGNLPPYLRHD